MNFKEVCIVVSFAFILSLGYCVGYTRGCYRVMETAKSWEKMYDEHINRQWDLIQKRDSLYVNALRLKLNYSDGHELTPESK